MKRLFSIIICFILFEFSANQALAGSTKSDRPFRPSASKSLLGSYLAGRAARRASDTEAAASYYYRAHRFAPESAMLRSNTLLLLMSDGRIDDALPLAPDVLNDDPKNGFANIALAVQAVREQRFSDVITMVEDAPAGAYNTIIGTILRAWAYHGSGDSNAALASLAEFKGSTVFEFLRDYHSGLIAQQAGRIEEAYAYFGDALAVNSSMTSRPAISFAAVLTMMEEFDKAGAMVDSALDRTPNEPMLLAAKKNLDQNKRIDIPVITISDGIAEAFYMIGAILASNRARGQQLELASAYLNIARCLKPGFSDAQMIQAVVMEMTGRWGRALALYESIAPDSAYMRQAQVFKAETLENLDRSDEAVALLTELSAADPSDRTTLMLLGSMLRGLERFNEAAGVYARAVALINTPVKNDWRVFYQHGVALERAGDWEAAEPQFLKALELNPKQPLVLNYLGYSWVDKGLNLERALEMVQEAVDQRPDDGYIIDSLGWAYYRIGDYEKAVQHLERSIAIYALDPTINDHLGDAYWKIGRKREAYFQWKHALTFKPEEQFLAMIKRKIEVGLDVAEAEQEGGNNTAQNGTQSTE